MMKNLLFILFLLMYNNIYTQNQYCFYDRFENAKHNTSAGYNLDINSTTITNEFVNSFLNNKPIDDPLKNRIEKELTDSNNRIGGEMSYYINFTHFPDTLFKAANLGYYVGFKYEMIGNANFSGDLFNLIFNGNREFAGKTADISNSGLNYLRYKQLNFGLIKKYYKNEFKQTISFGIGLNTGLEHLRISVDKGELFTAETGEYIDLNTKYSVYRSDSTTRKKTGTYGMNISISADFSYTIETPKKNIFQFSIDDIGYIKWRDSSWCFTKDTSMHFEGWEIDDILDINGSLFNGSSVDSIINKHFYDTKSYTYYSMLPVKINLSYFLNADSYYKFLFGIKHILYANYRPMIYIKGFLYPGKNNMLSANINYGGYGCFNIKQKHQINLGIEIGHSFNNGFIFIFGSNFINGFVYPRTTMGQGFYVMIQYRK